MTEAAQPAAAPSTIVRTFLIADVRGYTAFTNEHGVPAAAQLADRFAVLSRATVAHHEGEVIELRGDEALAVFPAPRSALLAAMELQGRFQQEMTDDPKLPLRVGMGIDMGQVVPIQGGYRGKALNLAARLCSLAGPTEVFASEEVITEAERIEGLAYVERGRVRLKGFSEPIRVIHVLPQEDLPEHFPPLVSLVAKPSNLPLQTTPFIGRAREIEEISQLILRADIRLLTLTGTGGTGKTRLAVQAGGVVLDHFERGVYFVNLAPLTDPSLVPSTVASTLKVKEVPGQEILATLIDHLKDRELLLILDNVEHLLDAADVVHQLLVACSRLKILVTTRIPLHLSSEHEYPVQPLRIPDPKRLPGLRELTQYDAVALLIERASAIKPDFAVTNTNAPAVAEICHRLDGLPLAIELAAAWIKLFPPQALLQRLDNRLKLLKGGAKDRPTRQRTLRGAIDWSYSLLSPDEQILFARLSVFVGGCTFEAAEAVCDPEGDIDLLEDMASLVNKSLLRQDGDDEPRVVLLETLREYAAERLVEHNEMAQMENAHADYFLAFAELADSTLAAGAPKHSWLQRLDAEQDNLRIAIASFLRSNQSEHALRLSGALHTFWWARGYWREGRHWLEQALAVDPQARTEARAKALSAVGALTAWLGDLVSAFEYLNASLSLYRDHGNARGAAQVRHQLALVADWQGEREHARRLYQENVDYYGDVGDADEVSSALHNLGVLAWEEGDLGRARSLLEDALQRRSTTENREGAMITLASLGRVLRDQGEYQDAEALLGESLRYAHALRLKFLERTCLNTVASLAIMRGQLVRASRLFGAAAALEDELGAPARPFLVIERQRFIRSGRSQLGEMVWTRAWEEGRAMNLEEAVAYALQETG